MLLFGTNVDNLTVILAVEFIGGFIAILAYYLYNRGRLTAYLCESYLNTWKIKKKMKPKMIDINFTWKNFTYHVDLAKALVDNKNKPVLYYDYLGAEPIQPLTGMKVIEDSQVFKVVNDGKIMQHFGDRKLTRTYMYVIIGLVLVVGVVSIASLYMMNQDSKMIAGLMRELMNVTKTINNGVNPPTVIK